MNTLRLIAASALLSCLIYSCSTSRNSSPEKKKKRNKITTLTPGIENPSQSVINASGDGLSTGINQPRGNGSRQNATNIASDAIERANGLIKDKQQILETPTDTELINRMITAQLMEISVSSNVRRTTTNAKITDYANLIIGNHKEIYKELTNLSSQKNIVIDAEIPGKSANKTDLDFVKTMIESNRNLITLYTFASNNAKTPELRTFALKQLPLLKTHLEAAQELTKEVKTNSNQ
ncbi:DUF4142 domain-containing protein [Pedobacter cryoconitis]|uniref:Putative outer membrane protein n=1 Tax=Pedobacter cryoconitis TaxID=188932 RepID=A0A7X0J1K6_9SPHI|nr:DUF4142 domain-containing protein [Pedobacter cryoconitis]MBB6498757.1 putative outer membrane protein [Pedobacter cryoconitis]